MHSLQTIRRMNELEEQRVIKALHRARAERNQPQLQKHLDEYKAQKEREAMLNWEKVQIIKIA